MKVQKKSGKPFKSRLLINTVKGETINPNTNKPAYTFIEDDSVVDMHMCEEIQIVQDIDISSLYPTKEENGRLVFDIK